MHLLPITTCHCVTGSSLVLVMSEPKTREKSTFPKKWNDFIWRVWKKSMKIFPKYLFKYLGNIWPTISEILFVKNFQSSNSYFEKKLIKFPENIQINKSLFWGESRLFGSDMTRTSELLRNFSQTLPKHSLKREAGCKNRRDENELQWLTYDIREAYWAPKLILPESFKNISRFHLLRIVWQVNERTPNIFLVPSVTPLWLYAKPLSADPASLSCSPSRIFH